MDMQKRQQIIEQAYEVFYKNGFHASGMDLILEGTGISKRTLYKYFASKEDLIAETVKYYHETSLSNMTAISQNHSLSPLERIVTVFDVLEQALKKNHVFGCFAVNAKLEFAGKQDNIEAACSMFFEDIENSFEELCREAGCNEPKKIAAQLAITFRGSIVTLQNSQSLETITAGKNIAKLLVQSALQN